MMNSAGSRRVSPLQLQALATLELRRRARLRAAKTETVSPAALELLEFIPAVTPKWEKPDHLARIVELFARAEREEVRALVSVPPQHGKTETILHGCAWLLSRHPDWPIGYTSYSANFAHSKSRLARDYAVRAGVKLREDSGSVREWRTTDGGGMLADGIGGTLTGHGLKFLVIDDPHKNREEAESSVLREKVHDFAKSTAFTRVHPGGSILVVHTRWHEDDLIGRLAKERGWEVINLQALDEEDRPLWPAHRPKGFLDAQRESLGPYEWWALYMGQPRPRGGAVFKDVHYYETLPDKYRVGIGIDLAYTSKTHSDWCVAVAVAEADGEYYLLDVRRQQSAPPAFAAELRTLAGSYPGARMLWYTSTTEKGLADLLREESGFPITGTLAKADKFVRAQPVAAAWNAGKVYVPRDAAWLPAFLNEVCSFSGVSDRHDDQVDALAAAFDVLARPARAVVSNHVAAPGLDDTGIGY